MSKQKWVYEFRSCAIADTGDYEDWVTFTNGDETFQSLEDITDEDALRFCDLLNMMPDLWSHKHEECKIDLHLLRLELADKIQAAVAAERRRVWDALNHRTLEWPKGSNAVWALGWIREYLFPEGEPEEVNPPAGERREM